MLSNKVIFITGASGVSGISHIGIFLERDAMVIATDIDDEGVYKIINKFKNHQNKDKLIVLKLDVTCEISIGKVLKEVVKYKPNVFINNAAITGEQLAKSRDYSSKLSEMTYNQWKQAIDVNLSSAFMIAKEVDKYYVGKYPIKVINIASIYGSMAPHHCLYEFENQTVSCLFSIEGGITWVNTMVVLVLGKIRCNRKHSLPRWDI